MGGVCGGDDYVVVGLGVVLLFLVMFVVGGGGRRLWLW